MRVRRRTPFADAVTTFGAGVMLRGTPMVDNQGAIHIGDRVTIASRPVVTHLATGPDGCLEVGPDVRIGHGGALSSLAHVSIGASAVLGAFVMIMDSDFHVAGDRDTPPLPEPVRIGRGVRLGHRAVVLPGTRIGDGAIIEAGSVVAGTVAAGARVRGNPAVVLATGEDEQLETVGAVVGKVFGLSGDAPADLTPHDVEGWDSLGMLRLLLELESIFDVVLDDRDLATVTRVGDLERIVTAARRRQLTWWTSASP